MEHGRGDAEVDDVLRLWSGLSRRRESRGRVGVLEDVLFAVWIFRGRVAATPRLQRGYSEGTWPGRRRMIIVAKRWRYSGELFVHPDDPKRRFRCLRPMWL